MSPQASIIIPSYNCAEFLGRALDSVVGSSGGDIEILVVDDGSTDGTAELVRRYGRAVGYLRQENRGPGAARNTGLAATRGEIVVFLDADDEYAPGAIPALLEAFGREPQAGWAVFHVRRKGTQKDEIRRSTLTFPDPLAGILRRNTIERACYRRSVLLGAGTFCEDLRIYEDWDLYIRLIDAGHLPILVDSVLYTYWERSDSVTRNRRLGRAAWRILLRRQHRRFAAIRGFPFDEILAEQLWALARETWSSERNLLLAGGLILQSFRAAPSLGRALRLLRTLPGAKSTSR